MEQRGGATAVIALLVAGLALSGCSGAEGSAPVTVKTVTVTAPEPAGGGWDASRPFAHEGKAPPFPDQLDGWRLAQQWSPPPIRAFTESWTMVDGPDGDPWNGGFPASSNGCGDGLFLVRWRAVDGLPFRLASANGSQPLDGSEPMLDPDGPHVTSTAGWAVLDGCHSPVLQMIQAANGTNLQDVAFEVQEWQPAP